MHVPTALCVVAACAALGRGHLHFEPRALDQETRGDRKQRILVECPVCQHAEFEIEQEECSIRLGGRLYKECQHDVYSNHVCGGRRDCYKGPCERCTEKMEFDIWGKKCAPSYNCDLESQVCVGLGGKCALEDRFVAMYPLQLHRRFSE